MALGLVNPYLSKLIIDRAYVNKDVKLFISLVMLAGVIFVLTAILKGAGDYLNRYIRLRIGLKLEQKVFKKLQGLSYRYFQNNSTGEHLYKISYDIERAVQFISGLFPQFISLIPKSLFIFGIILYLHPKMALLALLSVPFLYILPYYFTIRLNSLLRKWIENSQAVFKKLYEILSHIQLIKAYGKEKRHIKEYISGLISNVRFRLMSARLEVAGSFMNSLTNRAVLGLIIFYGGYQVIKGRMTLGSLSAIAIYLSQLAGLQTSLAFYFQQISEGLVSCDRLGEILDSKPDFVENRHAREIFFPKGDIAFKGVTFGYQQDKIVLNNLNFDIKGGSCIALTGPSGCGKTTIINLILRLYQPLNGEITIDGNNINNIKSVSLYEQIGVVLQEPYLWDDTIANNIRYGDEKAGFRDIEIAAEVICIHGFINGLVQGYDTVIGENACKISEGQKQRIAIARAVIKKPRILILYEALSSVDTELEEKIISNIRAFLNRSTIIVISHRPSTIQKTDLVYFLSSSDKIETGVYGELLEKNAQYQNYLALENK